LRTKLAPTDKQSKAVPLGAVLFASEANFAAAFISTGCIAATGATAVSGGIVKAAVLNAVMVCVAAICIAVPVLYFVLQENEEPYTPAMIVVETEAPTIAIPTTAFPTTAPPTTEPLTEPITEPITTPATTPATEPPTEPPTEPAPLPPPDRTAQILLLLSTAATAYDTSHIVDYFNFMHHTTIQVSTDMQFRFYVTNEGSGDILVGIASYPDGTNHRMQYEHFTGGYMPQYFTDLANLFDWMSE